MPGPDARNSGQVAGGATSYSLNVCPLCVAWLFLSYFSHPLATHEGFKSCFMYIELRTCTHYIRYTQCVRVCAGVCVCGWMCVCVDVCVCVGVCVFCVWVHVELKLQNKIHLFLQRHFTGAKRREWGE